MKLDRIHPENTLFDYIDQLNILFSSTIWESLLMNCTKNEMLILLLLFRKEQINMTQIADYIHVPLNTATGIVARMENKHLVRRERSLQDKRVVTIVPTQDGTTQMLDMIALFDRFWLRLMEILSDEEIKLIGNFLDKVLLVAKESDLTTQDESAKRMKKITIE